MNQSYPKPSMMFTSDFYDETQIVAWSFSPIGLQRLFEFLKQKAEIGGKRVRASWKGHKHD